MNNNNNNNKMNIVTKTFTNLPDEVCNIIYEYYKLPFADELPKTTSWSNCEQEWGRELTELIFEYSTIVRTQYYKNMFRTLFGYNDFNHNQGLITIILKDDSMSMTKKLIIAKNILVYNYDSNCIPSNKELNSIYHSKAKHIINPFVIDEVKEHARQNGIRVQKNSKMETLIKRLMKV
jgi:hypothetical protein